MGQNWKYWQNWHKLDTKKTKLRQVLKMDIIKNMDKIRWNGQNWPKLDTKKTKLRQDLKMDVIKNMDKIEQNQQNWHKIGQD